jgi:hypothetical protein
MTWKWSFLLYIYIFVNTEKGVPAGTIVEWKNIDSYVYQYIYTYIYDRKGEKLELEISFEIVFD